MKKFDAEKYFLTKWHFFLHVFKRAYTVFLTARYSDIISLLTIIVRGVSNKHCLLPFFIIY